MLKIDDLTELQIELNDAITRIFARRFGTGFMEGGIVSVTPVQEVGVPPYWLFTIAPINYTIFMPEKHKESKK